MARATIAVASSVWIATGCTLSFDPALLDREGAGGDASSSSSPSSSSGQDGGGGSGGGSGGASAGGSGGVPSAYRAAVLEDQPIAYWRLGEAARERVAADETGSYPGTYHGGVGPVPGVLAEDSDGATAFDGIGAFVEIDDEPSGTKLEFLEKAAFSIEAWIRPNRFSGVGYVICKRHDLPSPDDDGYALSVSAAGDVVLTRVQAGAFDSVSAPIVVGEWTHVVATYDGTAMSLYLDGGPTPAASEPSGAALPDIEEPLRIGARSAGGEFFDGVIDEVAIYDKALSYTRIGAHHAAALSAR